MMSKTCTRCGKSKPLSDFPKDSRATGTRSARGGLGVGAACNYCLAEKRKPGTNAARSVREAIKANGQKRCGTCEQLKLFSDFHKRAASNDGLAYSCISCVVQRCRLWKAKNPGAFKEWCADKKEARAESWRAWYAANKGHRSESYAKWARENKHIVNALTAKRVAAKKSATPAWADHGAIRAIYAEAARLTEETGIRHEVDHFYPLQGDLVCGLHCEANLQILTKVENIRKLNRMPEDHYEANRNRSSRSGDGASGARVRVKGNDAAREQG